MKFQPENNIVALVEYSHLIEDFLDNIGVPFEGFRDSMTGGWLFGYVEAMKLQHIQTVIFCFSAKVKQTEYHTHKPTGALICVLPSPGLYRFIRKRIYNPYTRNLEEAAGIVTGFKRNWYSFLLSIAAYASTPFFKLRAEIRKQHCRVILCQDYEHARYDLCALLAKWMSMPLYASFQGGNWQLSKVEKRIRPITLKWAKALIVASSLEKERLTNQYNYPHEKLSAIFNPVDILKSMHTSRDEARLTLKLDANAIIVIWHGRIDYYRKGLDLLLDVWQEITTDVNHNYNYQLILLGNGNNAEKLRNRLENIRVRNVIWIDQYINDRQQIYNYLRAANMYVFPSRNEGFPVAPIEAMACGLPIVAANAPGIADILQGQQESGGIIVPVNDAKALEVALKRLLADASLREKMGRHASANVTARFSLMRVGKQLAELFKFNHANE